MKEPLVAVVVANYNGKSYIYRRHNLLDLCLKPLLKADYSNYKIIVTDDCSTDDSIAYLKKRYKNRIDITKTKQNGKFARNNNNGMRYALKKYNPDYILLISNDVISKDKSWLRNIVETAELDDNIGLVGPKLIYPNGKIQSAGVPFGNFLRVRGQTDNDGKKYSKIEKVEAVTAVTVLIKRKTIEKIGLLDENFIGNFEDVDYCLRAGEAGFDIIYNGKVKLIHLESYTNVRLSKAPRNRESFLYEEQRNYGYFILKHSKGFKLIPSFLWLLLRTIVVKGGHGHVGITNFRIEGPVFKKIGLSLSAWKESVNTYKNAYKQ